MIADLAARVTWTGGVTVAALTAGAWWLAGPPAAAGVGGAGSIALLNFRWLARDVSRATRCRGGRGGGAHRPHRIGDVPGPSQSRHAFGVRRVPGLEVPARPEREPHEPRGPCPAEVFVSRGKIEHPPILHIPAIPDHILYTWIVMAILVVVSFVATRRVSLVPTGTQNFMELVLDQFVKELDETIGHESRPSLPLIATLGRMIISSKLMGLDRAGGA
jgi:hypothetical protein